MQAFRRLSLTALFVSSAFVPPAHAVSKEMVQLQTQVQQLQDAVARLQQSNDERMGVLKDLVQQTADSVNRMSVTVGSLQRGLGTQLEAATAKQEQISGQLQALNDSLDEVKARMSKLDRAVQTIEGQQQSANAMLQAMPAVNGATANPTSGEPSPAPPAADPTPTPIRNIPQPQVKPSVGELYRAAYGDYIAAKYPLAASEFNDIIKAYPDDNLSGNAHFYLAEMNARTSKPSAAIKEYDRVLEHYPDNVKIPAAHLHKADALISMRQNDAAVRELRALIQRFPNSPEAGLARTKLGTLGVSAAPRR